jgi:hypothetical protein
MSLETRLREVVLRATTIAGLAGIGLIHLLDSTSKFKETPYMGWMYVGLIAGTLVAAGRLVRGASRTGWALAGGLAAAAIVGYCLSRTIGLPSATGDVGNWSEPLGMASLFVEGCVVALSLAGLGLARTQQRSVARDSYADLPIEQLERSRA